MRSEFDSFSEAVPHGLPLEQLEKLQLRAKYLLRGRTVEQINEASRTVEILIDEYFYVARERWIHSVVSDGHSILGYMDYERRTADGVRYFIENNSSHEIKSLIDYPTCQNTSDLEALLASFDEFDFKDEDLPDVQPYEYVTVLGLKKISDAVNNYLMALDDAGEVSFRAFRWHAAEALDAMECICTAEHMRALKNEKARWADEIPEKAEQIARQKLSLAGRKAAKARHEKNDPLKAKLENEWFSTSGDYDGRADFVRIIAKRENLKERTLYKWLSDADKRKSASAV